jgi:quercetin dioxygenase-like cupin family protein
MLSTKMGAIGSSSIWLHGKRHREAGVEINVLENKMKCKLLLMSLPLLVSIGTVPSGALSAEENKMSQTITPAGSQPAAQGPVAYFTGNVKVEPLFPANDLTPVSGAYVTFEPGARSAWHTHPAGQHLVVTAGLGWTQVWGGPIVEIRPGDVVWCPPGVKHWHGASPAASMTHLALTGTVNGKNVEWMEKVTDDQYRK